MGLDRKLLDDLIERTKNAQAEAETRKLFHGFEYETTKTKWRELEDWKTQHTPPLEDWPTMGELFTYEITPTSMGTIVTVRDNKTKDDFQLTDWGLFG